jgi:hypothetical protein
MRVLLVDMHDAEAGGLHARHFEAAHVTSAPLVDMLRSITS